ncbi:MAG: diguanylate cyclase [Campylobacteraceae bacterium]|nr:diguanylate cyclase [Campylobacteraceae bacterium]
MSRVRKIFSTDTFKGRLRAFIINLILIIVLIISSFLIFMNKTQIKENYQRELSSIVRMQNQAIESWLTQREVSIRTLASNNDVKTHDLKRVKSLFDNFIDHQSDFYFVSLVDLKGKTILDTTFLNKADYSNKEFFIEALDGVETISRAEINKNGNIPVIHFTSPVYNEENEIISLVVAAVRLSSIQAIVESFRFGKTGETFIINSHSQLLTKRRFDQNHKLLEKVILGDIKNGLFTSYTKDNVLGAYVSSNFDRWLVVAQISEYEMYEIFKQFITYILIFIIVLLLITMPFVLRFSDKIVKPIQSLLHGSKKIQDGDYGHEIEDSSIQHATCELRDLTKSFNAMSNVLKNVIDELTTQSTIDVLSKLYNRRELMRLSELKFNKSLEENKHISLLMIDIDFFKKINDSYGHQTGDVAIEMVSNTIKTSIGANDIAGRYGGEEFLVFIENSDSDLTFAIAQRIRKNVENLKIEHNDYKIQCTCSVGVFYMKDVNKYITLEQAIEISDKALYEAKDTGRNKVILKRLKD